VSISFGENALKLTMVIQNSVDQNILQHMIDSQSEFLMEVTDKTKADVKVRLICSFFDNNPILIIDREEH
jgi:UDP-N-acetylglucosamine pyrophosphorylase